MRLLALLAVVLAPAAARAEVSFSSDGKAVRLALDVKDRQATRFDLWLAVVPVAVDYVGDGHALYLVDGKADPRRLAAEMKHPRLSGCGDGKIGRQDREAARLELFGADPQLGPVKVDFGLVHLGLFADFRPAVVYDRERYQALGGLGPIERGISYQVERTADGYHVEALLAPEAFGFMPRAGLRKLRARVDVFDGERPAARRRDWQEVTLAVPLGAPELGEPGPAVLMRGPGGWVGVERAVSPAHATVAGCRYQAEHVETVRFLTMD